jgi:hypothetical protein
MTSARADLIPLVDVAALRVEVRVCARDHDLPDTHPYAHFDQEWVPVTQPHRAREVAARYAALGRPLGLDDFMGGYLFAGDGRPWEHEPTERYIYNTTDYLSYMTYWFDAARQAALGASSRLSIYGTPFLVDVDGDHVVLRPGLRTSSGRTDADALARLHARGAWDMRASRSSFVGQVAAQLVAFDRFGHAVVDALPPALAEAARGYVTAVSEPLRAEAMDLANLFAPSA